MVGLVVLELYIFHVHVHDIYFKNLVLDFTALEEWRKRKMERARQRELGKNGTAVS